jgi:cytochrome oxidase Cu insertion factor (SCO1/SenC/PrrC family)
MQRKLANVFQASLLAGAMTVALVAPARAQTKQSERNSMPKVGDMAPDFKLNYFDGTNSKDVSLSQYRGKKNVVLAFFIFAFTGG